MGWLDAILNVANNIVQKSVPVTPRPQQPSAPSQPASAPSNNIWQTLSNIAQGRGNQPQQQQGAPAGGGGWDAVTQSEYRTNGSSSAGGTIKQPQKKTEDEKSIYSDQKSSGGGKAREKQPWHQAMDSALGNEGVGGVINDLLSYNGLIGTMDTISPEWAHNPTQMSDRDYALQSLYPNQFKGQEMPSGEQMANMTPEQREQWGEDTAEGLGQAAAVGLSALPMGSTMLDPVLSMAKKNKGSGKAARRAASEAKVNEYTANNVAKEAEKNIEQDSQYAMQQAIDNNWAEIAASGKAPKGPNLLEDTARLTPYERATLMPREMVDVSDADAKILREAFGDEQADRILGGLGENAGKRELNLSDKNMRLINKNQKKVDKGLADASEKSRAEGAKTLADIEEKDSHKVKNAVGNVLKAATIGNLGGLGFYAATEPETNKRIGELNNWINNLVGVDENGNPIAKDQNLEGNKDNERMKELGRLGLRDEESFSPLKTQYNLTDPNQLYYGHTLNELGQMYENEIFNAAMEDPEYRELYRQAGYLEPFGSYTSYSDLGDNLDYVGTRSDVTRDIFGLNPDRPDLEIKGLQQIYKEQGVINDKMTDEEKLQAILEDRYVNNRIDPTLWLEQADYEAAHPLLGTTQGKEWADYWIENGYIPPDAIDALKGLGNNINTLDAKDIAAMINTGNIANQMLAGTRFDPSLFGGETGYLTDAGDRSEWQWLSGDKEKDSGLYRPGKGWNPNGRDYSAAAIGQALAKAANDPDATAYWNLNAYPEFGIDADQADYLAAIAEQTDKQKRSLGRKEYNPKG